jgi:hypothetical protein
VAEDANPLLGTSQLEGCRGDFCNFDLSPLESAEVAEEGVTPGPDDIHALRLQSMSSFRRTLITGDADLTRELTASLSQAAAAAAGQHKRPTQKASLNKRDERLSYVDLIDEHDGCTNKIAMRAIIQARQEMPLVSLQLRRHRRGESGDYVTEDSYLDTAVGGKLPSYYYRDVPVCHNCYKVGTYYWSG